MGQTYAARRRVEFRDTDAAGMMHFSAYFTYMEEAEHEFLRSLGTSVVTGQRGQRISWPRVHAHCDYRAPLRFEESFAIFVAVERIGEKSVTYRFSFERDGKEVGAGTLTAVCCAFTGDGVPRPTAIPAEFAALLEPFLVD